MNYLQVKIGSVCDSVSNWNPQKQASDQLLEYIDIASVDREAKTIADISHVLGQDAPSRAKQLVKTGDVLVSTVRPNLNAVAQVPHSLNEATASTGFTVLRPSPERLDGRYLFHWVRSPRFVANMILLATGASYPAVTDSIVKESLIPLPEIHEQKRIAAILDKADALRQKRRQAIVKLDELLQSVFLDMFGDPVTNPMGWPTQRLIDIVDQTRGISYGVVQRGDHDDDGDYVIRIKDIVRGKINIQGMVRTAKSITSQYKRTRLKGGEIVISIRGTVGRTALVPDLLMGSNITRELALIPLLKGNSSPFVLGLLRTSSIQRRLTLDVKGVAQSGINLEDLRELSIIMPDPRQIQRYEETVGKIEALSIERSASEYDDLFLSLQRRAFEGVL